MKRSFLHTILIFLLMCASVLPAFAGGTDLHAEMQDAFDYIAEEAGCKDIQQLLDTWAKDPAGCEINIISVRNHYEDLNYSKLRKSLEKYAETSVLTAPASRLRLALALQSLESGSTYISETLEKDAFAGGIMTQVFALHIINNGGTAAGVNREEIYSSIMDLQLNDGGWAVMGEQGDADVTAMVLQALAPVCSASQNGVIKESCDNAIAFLSSCQLDNGGFKSFGEDNPESDFEVLMALSSLGIDGLSDERFIKNGKGVMDHIKSFALEDGSYAHKAGGKASPITAEEALSCFVSYEMFRNGEGPYYVFKPLSQKDASLLSVINIKTIIYIAAGTAVLLRCILLLARKNKRAMAYISPIVIGALVCAGVYFINIEKTEDYYKGSSNENASVTTYITIDCSTVAGRKEHIPEDGIILENTEIQLPEGSSAYDQLVEAVKTYSIQLDSSAGYVKGMNYLYEFEFGDLSGWMLRVNGEFTGEGSSSIILKDGDKAEWLYTTDLGKDVGDIGAGYTGK